jgi:hypothetical protein
MVGSGTSEVRHGQLQPDEAVGPSGPRCAATCASRANSAIKGNAPALRRATCMGRLSGRRWDKEERGLTSTPHTGGRLRPGPGGGGRGWCVGEKGNPLAWQRPRRQRRRRDRRRGGGSRRGQTPGPAARPASRRDAAEATVTAASA